MKDKMTAALLCSTDPNAVNMATEVLRAGGIVIVPTETVYGMAALANDGAAIKRIYQIKGREPGKALLPHINGMDMAKTLGKLSPKTKTLIRRYWPGPLTLVVPAKTGASIHSLARGGMNTLALRCPDHPFTLQLIEQLGHPLVAPSANMAGEDPPTQVSAISKTITKQVDLIIDGGAGMIGQSSTLLDMCCQPPKILRHGAMDRKILEEVSGPLG